MRSTHETFPLSDFMVQCDIRRENSSNFLRFLSQKLINFFFLKCFPHYDHKPSTIGNQRHISWISPIVEKSFRAQTCGAGKGSARKAVDLVRKFDRIPWGGGIASGKVMQLPVAYGNSEKPIPQTRRSLRLPLIQGFYGFTLKKLFVINNKSNYISWNGAKIYASNEGLHTRWSLRYLESYGNQMLIRIDFRYLDFAWVD